MTTELDLNRKKASELTSEIISEYKMSVFVFVDDKEITILGDNPEKMHKLAIDIGAWANSSKTLSPKIWWTIKVPNKSD